MAFYFSSSIGFIIAIMLQMGVFSRAVLFSGTADVVLLFLAAWSLHQRQKYSWILVVIFGLILSSISASPSFLAPSLRMAFRYWGCLRKEFHSLWVKSSRKFCCPASCSTCC